MPLKELHIKEYSNTTILCSILVLAFLVHGSLVMFSFPNTYDNFVHTFFADHYRRYWFEPWEYRWYTGFTTTSYPPLVHQLGALFSFIFSLKSSMIFVWILVICNFVFAIYRYAKIWVDEKSALAAATFAIVSPSIVEAVHVFGQLPTITGIGFLLHATTETYKWIKYDKKFYLVSALSLFAVTVAAHHVTTIFGMIFFVAPVILTALMDRKGIKKVELKLIPVRTYLLEIWKYRYKLAFFGFIFLVILIGVMFPYWYWSKTDPITQVPIPHGSRDSFLEVKSSGIAFFIIPWGITLALLPYLFKRFFTGRNFFIGMSFALLVLLGTGGTTPIPKLLLGENAFNILTLDRFTFWATVMAIPFIGQFFLRFYKGDYNTYLKNKIGRTSKLGLQFIITLFILLQTILIVHLNQFRPLQPKSIDIDPITQFLDRDQHYNWRFLTLGFGDQVAWLSANTEAKTIDGNYHSARRVPELTSRAIERLENSKFNGVEGLGSLQQFLTIPEKYHLKFIFSNDKFYDPLLHYVGWHRVQRLENGIMVWEKQDIKGLPPRLPKKTIPLYQRIMWGTLPLICLVIALAINIYLRLWLFRIKGKENDPSYHLPLDFTDQKQKTFWAHPILLFFIPILMFWWSAQDIIYKSPQANPEKTILSYYDALDFKRFKEAHSYFNPEHELSFDQYIMEISVDDGLLSSYAKLDAIETTILAQTDSTAEVNTKTTWITPLEKYKNEEIILLEKKNNKWFLQPKEFDISIPPDQFISQPAVRYFKQGKRRVSVISTVTDDVVDRPELFIHSARLVKKDSLISVVGEIQNTDNLPAHITITAQILDSLGQTITTYNAKYGVQHKILPKEKTAFKIDFESLSWRNENDNKPSTLNPNEFKGHIFKDDNITCKIFAKAVAENTDIYKYGNIDKYHLTQKDGVPKIEGNIINTGVDEITIPELIISYHNENCQVKWVEHQFVSKAIRPQRKTNFNYKINNLEKIEIIQKIKSKDLYVNGLQQDVFLKGRNINSCNDPYMIYDNNKIKLSVNSFVGVPSLY